MLGKSKRRGKSDEDEGSKVIEVTAGMQGSLSFEDPVDFRINGKFKGKLDTLGTLSIGKAAHVEADITGEQISIAGQVEGKLVAKGKLELLSSAKIRGEIWCSRLKVDEGAAIKGLCHMEDAQSKSGGLLSIEEVAQYLEVEAPQVQRWASEGKLPAKKEGNGWRFEKGKLDQWIAAERGK